ncbi:hypothetical protein TNCV_3442801 [Trichonephila clavipes]|nr:hypothetical protein TNCV_3442801 [Trichonephila clavipes]
MLPVLGKKAVLEWCMEGLIGLSYVCPKCEKVWETLSLQSNCLLKPHSDGDVSFIPHSTGGRVGIAFRWLQPS